MLGAALEDALPDRYALGEEIGRGGMAIVYRARDLHHDRDVAIKVLRPELSAALGSDTVAAFLRTVGSRRTASAESAQRALEKFVRALAEQFDLTARDVSVIQSFGRFALERLAGECGGLDPGVPPDPRFVQCLILE